MKQLLGWLLRGYAAIAGYAVAVFGLVALVLAATGAITGERLAAAFDALRGRTTPAAAAVERKPADDLPEREQILQKQTQELQKLEERAAARLSLIKAEQETLDRKRSEAERVLAEAKKVRQDAADTKSDAELAANVPILSRMEPAGVVALLKDGDDVRFVRHLRAMRPTKAAEVLDALRTDPQFEQDFRRVPAEAPAGAKSRLQRLNEEFQKSP
ncbi:MAG: hypothetical protein JO332_15550 [Planctomycetaceae bacterium]|nr:hypothetical protein [Planctomycetaceae bacterium]